MWISKQSVTIETFDVVAFECAAVTPNVNAVMFHFAHEQCAGYGTTQWSCVEISFASSRNMKGTALKRD